MKVRDIMSSDVKCVSQEETIVRAAQIMREQNVGSVPVQDSNKVVGMLTDRDIVLRDVAEAKDPNQTNCGEIMSKNIVTCSPDMDVNDVANLMSKHQIRRIPVVEQGQVVGIVALGDLAINELADESAGEALSDISCQNNKLL